MTLHLFEIKQETDEFNLRIQEVRHRTCRECKSSIISISHRHQSWRMVFAYTHLTTLPAFKYAEIVPPSLPLPICLEKLISLTFPQIHSTIHALHIV